jgi:hypothetical protein
MNFAGVILGNGLVCCESERTYWIVSPRLVITQEIFNLIASLHS